MRPCCCQVAAGTVAVVPTLKTTRRRETMATPSTTASSPIASGTAMTAVLATHQPRHPPPHGCSQEVQDSRRCWRFVHCGKSHSSSWKLGMHRWVVSSGGVVRLQHRSTRYGGDLKALLKCHSSLHRRAELSGSNPTTFSRRIVLARRLQG